MKQLVSNLTKIFQIDLDASINSGQVFLWKKINSKWYGIDGNNVLVLDDNSELYMNEKKTCKLKKSHPKSNVHIDQDSGKVFRTV